jgi:hypothetical protein
MRKITEQSIDAFNYNDDFRKANMRVENTLMTTSMFLHDNLIAHKDADGLHITNAGWQSNTTKERLNGLNGVSIQQKNFVWYLNGKEWDGKFARVSPNGQWIYVTPQSI